jgi:NTP pyrophosphatase (non-canonical NTP hydrolase)
MNIQEWQSRLGCIYRNKSMNPDYIMVHLSSKCSELSRIFNHQKAHYIATDPYIIKALSWLVAMCNHFGINYEEALIKRFPGKCSYCLKAPCVCIDTHKTAIDLKTGRALTEEEIESELAYSKGSFTNSGTRISFDELREMIFKIYPVNKAFIRANFWAMPLGKLDEEKGELHGAYSAYLRGQGGLDDIATEVCDITAWLISFWDFNQAKKSLDAELSSYYRNGCPSCKQASCNCGHYSISKTEEELLRDVINSLRTISAAKVLDAKLIDDATNLAHEAQQKGGLSVGDRLLNALRNIQKLVVAAPGVTGAALKSAENIEKVVDALKELFK